MADRGEVKIRSGKIDDLITLYKRTYARISGEIITATTAGKIRRAKVMVRINYELTKLGVDVDKWVREEMPKYYNDGSNIALQDLKQLGVDLSPRAGAAINKEAITALTDETAMAFAESIRGISRSANRLLGDVLKQQLNYIIAEGKLTGETRKVISAALKQRLTDEGFTSLTDKAGRKWTFDRYSEMLARTKAVEARNQGLTNQMLQNGYDLVQVSTHNTKHKACRRWEGKILSLTGKTSGYPTLAYAKETGLFHPNCKHAINVINLNLAAKTKAYDNPFNR